MTFIVDGTSGLTFPDTSTQAASSKVLQVVTAIYDSQSSTTSSTYVTTNLTASITPKFSTSKILILVSGTSYVAVGAVIGSFSVFRGTVSGTNLAGAIGSGNVYSPTVGVMAPLCINYLDSPATTSSTTYTVGMKNSDNANLVYLAPNGQRGVITLMEIAA